MKKKRNKILDQAIDGLSVRKAPNKVWSAIAGHLDRTENEARLGKAIASYKVDHKAPESIWDDIARELEGQKLKKAIDESPVNRTPDSDFNEHLPTPVVRKRHAMFLYWSSGIAAGFALVFFLIQKAPAAKENVSIAYSEENVSEVLSLDDAFISYQQKDEVLEFIERSCDIVVLKCQSKKFSGLMDQYRALADAQRALNEEIHIHQNEVRLMNYLVDVEKSKAAVGKEILQLLMRS